MLKCLLWVVGVFHICKYTLGGTPLAEAVLCTRQIVAKLKKVERVSKVNVICLTDGESNPMMFAHQIEDSIMIILVENIRITYLCHQIVERFSSS